MTCVCIHQPDFLPYLGFFHRLLHVDRFVILDDVQFLRRGWHHRDKIKTPNGAQWLTLSVRKGPRDQLIKDVRLADDRAWIDTHLNCLRENYRDAPGFSAYFPLVSAIYGADHGRLIDINMAFLDLFFELFELDVKTVFSSDLGAAGSQTTRLVNIVKAVGGGCYLSGTGARAYLDEDQFRRAGIGLSWQEFDHPVYPQLHGEFKPYLSCIDLLFNCGAASKDVLWATHPTG